MPWLRSFMVMFSTKVVRFEAVNKSLQTLQRFAGAVFTETAPVRPGRTRATARRRPILPLYTSCTSSLLIPRVLSTHRPTDGQGHPGDDRFLRYARNDKGIARYDRGCGLVVPASERKSGPEHSMTAKAVGGKNIPPPPEASMGQVLSIVPFRFGSKTPLKALSHAKADAVMGQKHIGGRFVAFATPE